MGRIEYKSITKEHQSGGVFYQTYYPGFRRNDGTYELDELFDVLGNDGWEFVRETYSEMLFKRQVETDTQQPPVIVNNFHKT